MSPVSRMIGGATVLAALLLSFQYAPLEWLAWACVQTNRLGDPVSLAEEWRKSQRLDELSEQAAERIARKEETVERLLGGELTLLQTAARFRALHQKCESVPNVCAFFQTASQSEGWCRQVMNWAKIKVQLEQSPEQAEALHRRWEGELRDHMQAHGGRVELPE